MSRFDDQLPEDLRDIAARLDEGRATFTPLELDELHGRVQRRLERGARREPGGSLLSRLRMNSVAGLLAAGLMLTSGAGVVIAASALGGGKDTFRTTNLHGEKDASFCQYHGPHTETRIIHTRRGIIIVLLTWDCHRLKVRIIFEGHFRWRFGDGHWNFTDSGSTLDNPSAVTIAVEDKTYTVPVPPG